MMMYSVLRRAGFRLLLLPVIALAAACSAEANAAPGPEVTVYRTATCGCCKAWEAHLAEHGFDVKSVERDDLRAIKHEHGVPAALSSCHTAVVDGYVVEGHVPADVIQRLLEERPQVAGVAVPGMPIGSPGMEQGSVKEPYNVYTFDASGRGAVYESR